MFLATSTASAQACKAEEKWRHEHATAKSETITTDIAGTRATRITVCRAQESAATALKVEVVFPTSHTPRTLPPGQCTDTLAKWAIVRTQGKKDADGPSVAMGTYQVCREE